MWKVFLILLTILPLDGATYYVAVNGSDGAAGTEAAPWRTLQKGFNTAVEGDTVFFGPGDFAEYVTTAAHGNSASTTNYIIFKSNPTNTAIAETRQVRFQHRFNWIDGLWIDKTIDDSPAHFNGAQARIETAATGTVLSNCVLANVAWAASTNVSFINSNSQVPPTLCMQMTNVNFGASNFVAGGYVYLGSDSSKPYTNHNMALRIRGISADNTTVYLTNSAGTNFLVESGSNYWAVIHAGNDNAGYPSVQFVIGTGIAGPTNCLVRNCIVSNIMGCAFACVGTGQRIEGNRVYQLHSFEFTRIRTGFQNSVIRSNTVRSCPNIIWFDAAELADPNLHPSGASLYDYNVGFIHAFGSDIKTNVFEFNWIEGAEQQLGLVSLETGNNVSFIIRSNVFIGFADQISGSMNNLSLDHNTFYRVAYNTSQSTALGGAHSELQTNLSVIRNAWVDCGFHQTHRNEGWFTLVDCVNQTISGNYASGPEVTGWAAKTVTSTNTLDYNGGDPGFQYALNPIGPDGLPFTSDDGIRPLPNTSIGLNGVGALSPVSSGILVAHFSVSSPTNWVDYYYTNFSSAWKATPPGMRGSVVRPYTTPSPLGNVPAHALFNASLSMDGSASSTTNTQIITYGWDFGDGHTRITLKPVAAHTYGSTGQFLVTLTITNRSGSFASCSNLYRVLPSTNWDGNVYYVSTTGNDSDSGFIGTPWKTMHKAVTTATNGDVVVLKAGTYGTNVDMNSFHGTSTRKIWFLGEGWPVITNKNDDYILQVRKSNIIIDSIEFQCPTLVGSRNKNAVYIAQRTTNVWIRNCRVMNGTNSGFLAGISCAVPSGSPSPVEHQQFVIITNNWMQNNWYVQIELFGSNGIVAGNWILDTGGEGDAFRAWGDGHLFADNFVTNQLSRGTGGHPDFFQTFGTNFWLRNTVFERNRVFGDPLNQESAQICQIEMDGINGTPDYSTMVNFMTNVVFRNNLFAWQPFRANVDMDGTKWLNNLFFACATEGTTNAGQVFAMGGTKGSAYGTQWTNNAFVFCGGVWNTNSGYFPKPGDAGVSNWDATADKNFVCGSNYLSKATNNWQANGWNLSGVNGGNPTFVSIPNMDFRLDSGSPLKNVGATLSFTDDLDGNVRTGSWDIGPLEASDSSITPTLPRIGKMRGLRIGK